jgi:hypothetical protein
VLAVEGLEVAVDRAVARSAQRAEVPHGHVVAAAPSPASAAFMPA